MPDSAEEQIYFDVFLCHNNKDKDEVKKVARWLKAQNIRPWLDEWELPPGRPWLPLVEEQITVIRAAAIFVGENSMGPWQKHETYALLTQFMRRGCPVIPVLLDTVSGQPDLPPFLASMTWVDFRKQEPNPLQQLIWGIKQQKSAAHADYNPSDDAFHLQQLYPETLVHANPANRTDVDLARELGSSVALIDFTQRGQASSEAIENYYKGMHVGWDIILAGADVIRDQQEDLLSKYAEPVNNARMICLSGEPGAGKSTLAWRLAFEIAHRSKQLMIHIQNNEKDDVWYHLGKVIARYQLSPIIIVDDVFRAGNLEKAFEAFRSDVSNSNLNILIIATTRSNEIPEDLRLEFCEYVQLLKPSQSEKERVVRKLHKEKLNVGQNKRLNKADSWLVMMIELTSGESLKKIVKGTVERLKQDRTYEHVYKAYEYLCYAGQYQLPIPKTLLGSLDPRGDDFYLLEEEQIGKGLILYNRSGASYSTLHPLFAEEAFKACKKNPESVLVQLTDATDPRERSHRMFLCSLLFRGITFQEEVSLVEEEVARAKKVLLKRSEKIAEVLETCTHHELWHYWRGLYGQLCEGEKVALIENRMLERMPEDFLDWAAYLRCSNENGASELEEVVIERARGWLREHSEDQPALVAFLEQADKWGHEGLWMALLEDMLLWLPTHAEDVEVRVAVLGLVDSRGKQEHWQRAIEETVRWLQIHETDVYVRAAYLGLVDSRGEEQLCCTVIEETRQWLQTHEADVHVRAAYLGLVDRRGNAEHWGAVIADPRQRIRALDDDSYVCKTYLGLVDKQGEAQDRRRALEDTRDWLQAHVEDVQIRRLYLGLVDKQEQAEHWHRAIEDTRDWLQAHIEDVQIRRLYLGLIDRRGEEAHWHRAIEDTRDWLQTEAENVQIRTAYLELVEHRAKMQACQLAIEDTELWLKTHRNDCTVRAVHLGVVAKWGTAEQRKAIIADTTRWIGAYPKDAHHILKTYFELIGENVYEQEKNVSVVYLGLVEKYGTKELCKSVIEHTRQWLSVHDVDCNIRMAYIRLADNRGKDAQWNLVIEDTGRWLRTHEDVNVFMAYLRLVDRRGKEYHWHKAIKDTRDWLQVHDEDVRVRAPYLGLVDRRGREEHWYQAIRDTRGWLQIHDEDAHVRISYLGLVDRRGREEHWYGAIKDTRDWLQTHDEDSRVRAPYLGLVDRRGQAEDWHKAVEETARWLEVHVEDFDVRAPYLGLVDRRGQAEDWHKAIEETARWLQTYKEDFNVRTPYLGLVARRGNGEQLAAACRSTEEWLASHPQPKNMFIVNSYGGILLKLQLYSEAEVQFQRMLGTRKSFVPARVGLAWSYYYQGKREEAYDEFTRSQQLVESGNDYPKGALCFHLGQYWMLEGEAAKASGCFKSALSEDPSYYQHHLESGRAYLMLKEYNRAIEAFKKARELLPVNILPEVSQDVEKCLAEASEGRQEGQVVTRHKRRKR